MTNEEALQILSERDRIGVNIINANDAETTKYNNDSIEALSMAIEALKAEPCEDAVRRETVRDMFCEIHCHNERSKCVFRNICKYMNRVSALPPVTPLPDKIDGMLEDAYEHGYQQARYDYEVQPCEDVVKREAVLNTLDTMDAALDENRTVEAYKELLKECYKALPPVTPKPTECEDVISREAMLYGLASIAKAKARSDAQKSLMGRVMFFTEQLPPVAPKQRWIPVSDRLPKTHGVYNVTRRIDGADIADSCFYDGQGTWYDDTRINHERKYLHDITAWMPLPKPYKEGVSE